MRCLQSTLSKIRWVKRWLLLQQSLRGSWRNESFLFPQRLLYRLLKRCLQSTLSKIRWVKRWLLLQQSLRGSWRSRCLLFPQRVKTHTLLIPWKEVVGGNFCCFVNYLYCSLTSWAPVLPSNNEQGCIKSILVGIYLHTYRIFCIKCMSTNYRVISHPLFWLCNMPDERGR